ncbi:hypothetical protein BN2905_34630 [Achromobacter xylosoxidans]|uniref:hypothetical protein n=1 Tax=Alcaligenes xylosoxydans xylosoxydans TaxID=85698 RepID=UPI0012A7BE37|nr:hypothetical protein [Achromobacter xylosoxidans]CUR74460.1 hypothetical protein BN2905_34630 [Achromobacter xylosoxidans]
MFNPDSDEIATFVIHSTRPYRPAAEMYYAALGLIRDAEENPSVGMYKRMGALMFLAASIEGFGQTYGPSAFPSAWGTKGHIGDRTPPLQKLQDIGREVGIDVTAQPEWPVIKSLFDERNGMAHPKPGRKSAHVEVTCKEKDVLSESLKASMETYFPHVTHGEIQKSAQAVESFLITIHSALNLQGKLNPKESGPFRYPTEMGGFSKKT